MPSKNTKQFKLLSCERNYPDDDLAIIPDRSGVRCDITDCRVGHIVLAKCYLAETNQQLGEGCLARYLTSVEKG